MKKVWFGYVLDAVPCQLCGGTGERATPTVVVVPSIEMKYTVEYCELCEGGGETSPTIEIPQGEGWQMWETCSEGSPISPVLGTPEELAMWLAANGASAFGSRTATYEQWLATINVGCAPSAIFDDRKGFRSGVEAAAECAKAGPVIDT